MMKTIKQGGGFFGGYQCRKNAVQGGVFFVRYQCRKNAVPGSAAAGGLALFLAISLGGPAFADAAVSVKIDGQPLKVSAAPVIKDGRTLVPIAIPFDRLLSSPKTR